MPRILTLCFCLCVGSLAEPLLAADPPAYSAELLGMADKGDAQALARLMELAESGHAQAQYDVGSHYLHTIRNVDDEIPRIISWHQKAAEQGVSHAQLDLAVSLNMAGKPWYDPVQALKWLYVGMALVLEESPDGSQDRYAVFAGNNSFKLSKTLSKQQVSEAEALSRAWLDAHGISAQQEASNLGAFLKRYQEKHPQ